MNITFFQKNLFSKCLIEYILLTIMVKKTVIVVKGLL